MNTGYLGKKGVVGMGPATEPRAARASGLAPVPIGVATSVVAFLPG